MESFRHVPHPHIALRHGAGPPKVSDVAVAPPGASPVARFNAWLMLKVTCGVGTAWCAYAFCLIALSSLRSTLMLHSVNADVQWVAQTFLQLVLLAVIATGQNIQGKASDARSIATYEDASAVLAEALSIQAHLKAQDAELEKQTQALSNLLAKASS